MQEQIRATPREQFPTLDRFIRMKAENQFSSADFVAQRLFDLAFDPAHSVDTVLLRLPDEVERP